MIELQRWHNSWMSFAGDENEMKEHRSVKLLWRPSRILSHRCGIFGWLFERPGQLQVNRLVNLPSRKAGLAFRTWNPTQFLQQVHTYVISSFHEKFFLNIFFKSFLDPYFATEVPQDNTYQDPKYASLFC